jgi:hypothetical protein
LFFFAFSVGFLTARGELPRLPVLPWVRRRWEAADALRALEEL